MKFTDRLFAAQSKPSLLAHVEFVTVVTPEASSRISIDDTVLTFPGLSKWFVAIISAFLLAGLSEYGVQVQTELMRGGATFLITHGSRSYGAGGFQQDPMRGMCRAARL